MTPERVAALVTRWVRFYTRDLPAPVAARRTDEIGADLDEHIAHERAVGTTEPRIALAVASRMVRGVAADVAWRRAHATAIDAGRSTAGGPMHTDRTTYGAAAVLALGTALLLAWGVVAMGVVGAEGDSFDLLYLAVLAAGVLGAVVVRFRPGGMVRVLLAMAAAQAVLTVIALIAGKQNSPVSSVVEIVGLNGFFVALFVAAAWLFQRAARRSPGRHDEVGP